MHTVMLFSVSIKRVNIESAVVLVFQFLPVYSPSEEETRNPQLFAQNVRRIMAKYDLRVWVCLRARETVLLNIVACARFTCVGFFFFGCV